MIIRCFPLADIAKTSEKNVLDHVDAPRERVVVAACDNPEWHAEQQRPRVRRDPRVDVVTHDLRPRAAVAVVVV